MIRDNRGYISLTMIILLLAGIGGWFVYHSAKTGNLSNDLGSMIADCKRLTGNTQMTATDRASMAEAYNTISTLAAKYNINSIKVPTAPVEGQQ